jgi:hypothetical protein
VPLNIQVQMKNINIKLKNQMHTKNSNVLTFLLLQHDNLKRSVDTNIRVICEFRELIFNFEELQIHVADAIQSKFGKQLFKRPCTTTFKSGISALPCSVSDISTGLVLVHVR